MSDKFDYTYSAPTNEERKEIDSIRRQYVKDDKDESKLDRLRRLDKKVRELPLIISLIVGIVGCQIFGGGIALCLETEFMILGVILGIVGVCVMIANYFIYRVIFARRKERYAEEIIKLSEELLSK